MREQRDKIAQEPDKGVQEKTQARLVVLKGSKGGLSGPCGPFDGLQDRQHSLIQEAGGSEGEQRTPW